MSYSISATRIVLFFLTLILFPISSLAEDEPPREPRRPDIITHGEITALSEASVTVESVVFTLTERTRYLDDFGNRTSLSDFAIGDFIAARGFFEGADIITIDLLLKHDHEEEEEECDPLEDEDCDNEEEEEEEECDEDDEECEEESSGASNRFFHIEGHLQEITDSGVVVHNHDFFFVQESQVLQGREGEETSLDREELEEGDRIVIIVRESQDDKIVKLIRLRQKDHDDEDDDDDFDGPDGDDLNGPPSEDESIGAISELSDNRMVVNNISYKIDEQTRVEVHGGRSDGIDALRTGLVVRVEGFPQGDLTYARRIEVAPQDEDTLEIMGQIGIYLHPNITVRGLSARIEDNTEIRGIDGETIQASELRNGMLVEMVVRVAEDNTLRAEEIHVEENRNRGDFDNDGNVEKVVYRPEFGLWFIHYGSDKDGDGQTDVDVHSWGLPGDVPLLLEVDGDGRNEIAVYRPSTGTWFIRMSSSGYNLVRIIQWGLPGDLPVTGDYDGDGLTDIGVYRPAFGMWFIFLSDGSDRAEALNGDSEHVLVRQWGLPQHVPVPSADRDGDNRDDLVVWDTVTGFYYTLYSSSGFNRDAALSGNLSSGDAVQFGLPGDDPIVADFDGDGREDLSVFRDGWWFIKNSSGEDATPFQWGLPGDLPSVTEPTGEGEDTKAGFSVYRPEMGTHFDRDPNAETSVTSWGLPGDIPLGNKSRDLLNQLTQ